MFHRVMPLARTDFAISRSMMPQVDDRGDKAETKVASHVEWLKKVGRSVLAA